MRAAVATVACAASLNLWACSDFTDKARVRVSGYLARYLRLDPEYLKLKSWLVDKRTCYCQLTFEDIFHGSILRYVLSPDRRFLSPSVLDLATDPDELLAARASEARAILSSAGGDSPARGDSDAPVTIVLFVDFACPPCKRLDGFIKELPAKQRRVMRIIVKQDPLPGHVWAQKAAELAVCAGLQGPGYFSAFSDFFFREQATLTPEGIEDRAAQFAGSVPGLNSRELRECAASGRGNKSVTQDVALADRLQVDGTPTLFIEE